MAVYNEPNTSDRIENSEKLHRYRSCKALLEPLALLDDLLVLGCPILVQIVCEIDHFEIVWMDQADLLEHASKGSSCICSS